MRRFQSNPKGANDVASMVHVVAVRSMDLVSRVRNNEDHIARLFPSWRLNRGKHGGAIIELDAEQQDFVLLRIAPLAAKRRRLV